VVGPFNVVACPFNVVVGPFNVMACPFNVVVGEGRPSTDFSQPAPQGVDGRHSPTTTE
jgi:hypothetical protein